MRRWTGRLVAAGALAGLLSAPVAAAERVVGQPIGRDQVDKALRPKGQWLYGVVWTDSRGDNLVAFAASDKQLPAKGGADPLRSRTLQVRHFADGKLVREVNDKVERCPFDLTLELLPAAHAVTDLDGDGQGEVTFAYRLGCRSDVSPLDLKLLLLEDGAKYILRGSTKVFDGNRHVGGDFKAEPALASWPAAFGQHARRLWQAVVQE